MWRNILDLGRLWWTMGAETQQNTGDIAKLQTDGEAASETIQRQTFEIERQRDEIRHLRQEMEQFKREQQVQHEKLLLQLELQLLRSQQGLPVNRPLLQEPKPPQLEGPVE